MVAIFDFSKWRLFKVCYVFFTFFRGESENYTFLERLRPTDYENRCWHFILTTSWPPSWIFKMAAAVSQICSYLSF